MAAGQDRLQALAEVGRWLVGQLDAEEVVQHLAEAVLPGLADQVTIDVVARPGLARRRVLVADASFAEDAAFLERSAAPWPVEGSPAAQVLAGAAPIRIAHVDAEQVARFTPGPEERRAAAAKLRTSTAMAVPLPGRAGVLGALTLLGGPGRAPFDDDDLAFAVEVGVRAGLALEAATLHERQVRTARRLEALRRLTARLAEAGAEAEVAAVAVDAGFEALGADSASLCLVDAEAGEGVLVAERAYHPETRQAWGRFALVDGLPAVDAMRTGQPVVLASIADRDERYPVFQGVPTVSSAFVIAPLLSDARALGALTVGFPEGSSPSSADVEVLLAVGRQCALALERVRLAAQQAATTRTLQAALLPPALPDAPGLDLAVRYRPVGGGDIGGDLYDVFPVRHGGRPAWLAVVGDVCGKGAEAAALTSLVRWSVRTAAITSPRPASVLAALDEVVRGAQLGERFATLAAVLVQPDADGGGATALVASGGHPLPLVRRPNGDAIPVGRPGPLLGVLDDGAWPEEEVRLHPGDGLLLFTDGLLEARSPSGDFAPQLLERALHATAGSGAEDVVETVLGAVDAFERGRPRDDLAVLVVQVPAPQGELVRVRVHGTPSAAVAVVDEHVAELLRELELVRVGRHGGPPTYAQRLLTVAEAVLERFADARAALRDQAELAVLLGEPTFTAEVLVPAQARSAVVELAAILRDLGPLGEAGELLTLPPSADEVAGIARWLGEVAEQVGGTGAGGLHEGLAEAMLERSDRLGGGALPVAPPPPAAELRRAERALEHGPDMARRARRFVGEVLQGWGQPGAAEQLAVPVSEVVTNAQIHARTGVEVAVVRTDAAVRVEVRDRAPGLPALRSRERTAGTGRGLELVAGLADGWGVVPDEEGKVVWVEVRT